MVCGAVVVLRGQPETLTGSGSGSGSGYGSGDGYGVGSGSGDGYGSGVGYGSGSGYGVGDGYGSGSPAYWLACLKYWIEKWSDAQRARLEECKRLGARIAFWRSDKDGKPCNGGKGKPVTAGDVQKIAGPLSICSSRALHATELPPKWQGERLWCVALFGEIQQQEDKFGALHREIIGEIL